MGDPFTLVRGAEISKLSDYIPLNPTIEILNDAPKGNIGRLPIRVLLAFGRKATSNLGLQGESGMQNAELHLAAKKTNLAG